MSAVIVHFPRTSRLQQHRARQRHKRHAATGAYPPDVQRLLDTAGALCVRRPDHTRWFQNYFDMLTRCDQARAAIRQAERPEGA